MRRPFERRDETVGDVEKRDAFAPRRCKTAETERRLVGEQLVDGDGIEVERFADGPRRLLAHRGNVVFGKGLAPEIRREALPASVCAKLRGPLGDALIELAVGVF